jgi:hypothetical protein
MTPNLDLQIDELVLHGFSPTDRDRIGDAIRQELTRLFAERGIPLSLMQNMRIEQLYGSAFDMPANTRAEIIGTKIAHTIYQQLGIHSGIQNTGREP